MNRLAKLLGLSGDEKELDLHDLAPEGTETLVREVPVDDIHTNPFQPRRWFREEALAELAASVKEYGVLQPLLVRRDGHDRYELIAGERRLRASRLAGRPTAPVILVEMSDQEVAEVGLIENLQREDLHFLEEAESFKQLMGFFGLTVEKLAERMGKSSSTIFARLRLLKLDAEVREAVVKAGITEKHARSLLKLEDPSTQLAVIRKIEEQSLSTAPNLRVLTSGPIPPNPAELLGSSRMDTLLAALKGAADYLVLDSPPVIAVTDACVLARKADGVLLVLDADQVRPEMAQKAKELLENAQGTIIGVILNRAEIESEHSYYYYYYGHGDEKKAKKA